MMQIVCRGSAEWSIPATQNVPTLEQILALEEFIQTLPPVDCPVREYRVGDLYAREMTILKNTVLTKTDGAMLDVLLSAGELLGLTKVIAAPKITSDWLIDQTAPENIVM